VSIIVTSWANKATRNADDNVAKCEERTTTVCDDELDNMQETE